MPARPRTVRNEGRLKSDWTGAVEASSPAEVVSACAVTYAMLADPAASRATVFGSKGVLEGIKPGHAYVDNSTVDEDTGVQNMLQVRAWVDES